MHPIPTFNAKGVSIPKLGFGTSQMGDCAEIVAGAIKIGYRHIDTAWKYKTEKGVGEGIRQSGIPRHEIFLTTKVSHEYLRANDFSRLVDESLSNLKLEYVDLLLIHWPSPEKVPFDETLHALAKAKQQGKSRHVGVANCNIALIEEAIRLCPEPIINVQVEYHPYLDQSKLLSAVRRLGLAMTAYCPLGRGRIINDPIVADMAKSMGKSVAQVVLRWLVQQPNVIPIPRSSNPQRQAENFNVFDFELNPEQMHRLHQLARPAGVANTHPSCPGC